MLVERNLSQSLTFASVQTDCTYLSERFRSDISTNGVLRFSFLGLIEIPIYVQLLVSNALSALIQ